MGGATGPNAQSTGTAPEALAPRFAEFRRLLRERERAALDRIIARANGASNPKTEPSALGPTDLPLLPVLLDQELAIMRIERALDEISWAVLGRAAGSAGTLDAFAAPPPIKPIGDPAPR